MPFVTRLQAQKKDKTRVNLYIDDEFFCGLTLDDVIKNKLAVGMQLTEAELNILHTASDENALFNKTLVYILKSPKTEFQIKQYLLKKRASGVQVSAETINQIILRLKKLGYINDADYASSFTQNKSTKIGSKSIRQKLMQRGVERTIIDRAVNEIDDQSELAKTLATKYMRSKEADIKTMNNLFRFLVGKGFDFDLSRATVSQFNKNQEEI